MFRNPFPGFRWRLVLLACSTSFLLSACILTSDQSTESDPNDPRAQSITDRIRSLDLSPRATRNDPVDSIRSQRTSSARVFTDGGSVSDARDTGTANAANGEGYDLNFENAPIATVARVILSDILGSGYTIDPRVVGTVTLASGRPISKSDALYVLENALRMSNVAIVRDRTGYRVVPAPEAVGSGGVDRADSTQPGYGITVVPLRYVSAQTILKLLDTFGVKPNTVRADQSRNLVLLQGTAPERSAAIDTVLNFDTDWMKGQSVGVFPVANSSPEPLIAELEKIMDSGEGGLGQNMIKLQPISRQNAILVVTQKPEYLRKVSVWISRLDRSDTQGTNLKVYSLRYGSARAVTALLNEIIAGRSPGAASTAPDSAAGQVAPGAGLSASSSGDSDAIKRLSAGGQDTAGTGTFAASGAPAQGARPGAGGQTGRTGDNNSLGAFGNVASPTVGNSGALQNVRITADVTNNSILVYANQESHQIIEQTIRQIDRPQRQVAIDATIAEVTLNDNLAYGVQFFLKKGADSGSIVNTLGNAALNRVLPGFNLLIGNSAQPNVVLDALHGVTDVKVLSNPSLVVLDNQPATLQVGDQVPVSTGSATVLTANNTIVNTIDYRNTGIILRVQPRTNANGNIVLDIEQEISNVGSTDTTSLTPTISQRKVKSSISVASGQTVLLAGLISDQENKTRSGIPLLDQIPGAVGDAFSHQNVTKKRIELILFIRPTVVRDAVDAHVVAEELRSKLSGRLIGNNIPVPVLPAPNVRRQ